MKRDIIEAGLIFVSVFLFSYLVNYVWESLHAAFLYEDHDINAMEYVRMMSYVSAMDGLLILGIYLFIALLWRDVLWIRQMNGKQICTVLITGLLLAAAIEYRRVFVTKTWRYSHLMPILFGLGISPLFQLSATGLWAFWLTKKILQKS